MAGQKTATVREVSAPPGAEITPKHSTNSGDDRPVLRDGRMECGAVGSSKSRQNGSAPAERLSGEHLAVEQRAVESLIPYARNARTHSDAQVAEIAGSIQAFGWTNPILVDGENGVIAGHGRLLAARKLKLDTVPALAAGPVSGDRTPRPRSLSSGTRADARGHQKIRERSE